jgi:hypothetical protein
MTNAESINNIMELTEMNDELYEENKELKDEVIGLQSLVIEYQRMHIAELQGISCDLCGYMD